MPDDNAERLQKALARLGLGSRREAEEWIRAGRLTVNGQVASLGMRVRDFDQIRLDGRLVRRRPAPTEAHVFLYHRSPGDPMRSPAASGEDSGDSATTLSGKDTHERGEQAHESTAGGHAPSPWRAALQDRLPKRAGRRFIAVSPMPNIDGGLELLTSDGELAEKLQRSVRRLDSEFSVRVHGELGDGQKRQIREGVLDRGTIEVQSLETSGGEATNRWYTVQTRGASGKDIRQLFERQGAIVSRVLRTRLGPVTLDRKLARGQFRRLSATELDSLTAATSARAPATTPENSAEPRAQTRPRRPQKKHSKRPQRRSH